MDGANQMNNQMDNGLHGVIHYEKPLFCKVGTCSFCFKYSELCTEFEPDLVEDWDDENNHPILCQECDDLCWIHERPVLNTPLSACVCFQPMQNEVVNEVATNQVVNEVTQNEVATNQVVNEVTQNEVTPNEVVNEVVTEVTQNNITQEEITHIQTPL